MTSDRRDPVDVLADHFTWTGDIGASKRSIKAALADLLGDGRKHTGWQLVYGTKLQGTSDDMVRVKERWAP